MSKLVLFTIIGALTYAPGSFGQSKSKLGKPFPIMKVVPGKSLGEVSIGEDSESLLKKGFAPDGERDPSEFLRKDLLLVRLENGKAAQIWFDGHMPMLEIRGKKFPLKTDLKSLKSCLRDCGSALQGSGGSLIYCENGGIELSYDMKNTFEGLSVLAPKK